ncbi:hypothetical protein BDZ89DRAFT_746125 [Hymenopellis radicata]|nr:hypothetical protein BDZ89DRAFT_746125 [Hymenopellis radicata]
MSMDPPPAPKPFDSSDRADLVIITSDGTSLYVVKAFLIYASQFFANLLGDSSPMRPTRTFRCTGRRRIAVQFQSYRNTCQTLATLDLYDLYYCCYTWCPWSKSAMASRARNSLGADPFDGTPPSIRGLSGRVDRCGYARFGLTC